MAPYVAAQGYVICVPLVPRAMLYVIDLILAAYCKGYQRRQ